MAARSRKRRKELAVTLGHRDGLEVRVTLGKDGKVIRQGWGLDTSVIGLGLDRVAAIFWRERAKRAARN